MRVALRVPPGSFGLQPRESVPDSQREEHAPLAQWKRHLITNISQTCSRYTLEKSNCSSTVLKGWWRSVLLIPPEVTGTWQVKTRVYNVDICCEVTVTKCTDIYFLCWWVWEWPVSCSALSLCPVYIDERSSLCLFTTAGLWSQCCNVPPHPTHERQDEGFNFSTVGLVFLLESKGFITFLFLEPVIWLFWQVFLF